MTKKYGSIVFFALLLAAVALFAAPTPAFTSTPAPGSTINLGTVSTTGASSASAEIDFAGRGQIYGTLIPDNGRLVFSAAVVNNQISKHETDTYVEVSCHVPISFGSVTNPPVSDPPTQYTSQLEVVTSNGTFTYTLTCLAQDSFLKTLR